MKITKKRISPHAGISFTAHYTGQVWQKLGLSHSALATKKGKLFYRLLAPLNVLSKSLFGVDMERTLSARHKLIDNRAKRFIEKHPDAQIVEIAAGLSPRGWRFMHLYDAIDYIEVDLPSMSMLKAERAKSLPHPVPNFVATDIFSSEFDALFSKLDPSRPLLIITEGLINYFSLELIGKLARKLSTVGKPFSDFLWITENYPLSDNPKMAWLIKHSSTSLKKISKSQFSFYFYTPTEVANFFKQHGFVSIDVYQPSTGSKQPENNYHAGDSVWVLELH